MDPKDLQQLWQIVESTQPDTAELSVHSAGIKVDCHEICIGRDNLGRRHLLVPLIPDELKISPFKSAGLFVRRRSLVREIGEIAYLDLICLSPSLNEIFSHLVLDVLTSMQPVEPAAVEICQTTLERWKDLFGTGISTMGREQITGLVGELLVLDRLTEINPAMLQSWEGPIGGIHDFRKERRAIEVKTSTRRYGRFFTISGDRQLEEPENGDLHLVTIKLEQNVGGKYSIPSLVEKIRRNGVDPSLLMHRLREFGYVPAESHEGDELRFDISEWLYYPVGKDFPKIIPKSFSPQGLPEGILKISYEIDLSGSQPKSLELKAADSLLISFCTGDYL